MSDENDKIAAAPECPSCHEGRMTFRVNSPSDQSYILECSGCGFPVMVRENEDEATVIQTTYEQKRKDRPKRKPRCPRCGGGPGDPSCGKSIHGTF